MRLGQLARKLALRPGEIVEFLAKNNIHIDDGSNTRLDDEHVRLIQQRYAPDLIFVPAPVFEEIVEQTPVKIETEPRSDEEHPDPVRVEDQDGGEPQNDTPEVIKAPKISLSGLKVLGKIELPEPKKKETETALLPEKPVVPEEVKKPSEATPMNIHRKNPRPKQRPLKNPIALQREKEAQEEQRKRKERIELEKEKRRQNYYKKVKMSPPTKAVKMVEEETMQMSAEDLAEPPKTWFGKFLKWLTT